MEATRKQMMAIALARQVEDGKAYIVGTGLPLVGAALAKNTHAPNASLIFETALFEGNPWSRGRVKAAVSPCSLSRPPCSWSGKCRS